MQVKPAEQRRSRIDEMFDSAFRWLDRGLPLRRFRPLVHIRSLKLKFTIVLAVAVIVTAVAVSVGHSLGIPEPWTIAVAVVVAALVVQILARGITAPLRNMITATDAMASGDYGHQVPVESADEVGQLARSFNTMSVNLADLERQRDDLIANVSHELRTPIAVLHASLENLLDEVVDDERITLETMLKQTERLGRLVAELLELSRLEGGIVSIEAVEVDLVGVVRAAIAEAEMRALSPVIEFTAPRSVSVTGDGRRLHMVIANLLDNAVEHGGGRGPIRVTVAESDAQATVGVADAGPGVPPEDLDRIFDRFYRAGAKGNGLGLGLAIAQWVADLHGGSMTARNLDAGGFEITLSVPISAH